MHRISTGRLVQIASFGGIGLVITGMAMRNKLRDQVYQSDMYRLALKNLRTHPGAKEILGEPMKDKVFKINYNKNFCDGRNARFQIPIKGPKQNGTYYFWALKKDGEWVFTKAELGLENDDSRRLVIVKETEDFSEQEAYLHAMLNGPPSSDKPVPSLPSLNSG